MIIKKIKCEGEMEGGQYIREKMSKVLEKIKAEAEQKKGKKRWIVGQDFNARTGERKTI